MSQHECKYDADGGPCRICGRTVSDGLGSLSASAGSALLDKFGPPSHPNGDPTSAGEDYIRNARLLDEKRSREQEDEGPAMIDSKNKSDVEAGSSPGMVICEDCATEHHMGNGITCAAERRGYMHLHSHCPTCGRKTWSEPFKLQPMTRAEIVAALSPNVGREIPAKKGGES